LINSSLQWGRTFADAEIVAQLIETFGRFASLQWGRTFADAEIVQLVDCFAVLF